MRAAKSKRKQKFKGKDKGPPPLVVPPPVAARVPWADLASDSDTPSQKDRSRAVRAEAWPLPRPPERVTGTQQLTTVAVRGELYQTVAVQGELPRPPEVDPLFIDLSIL